MGRREYSGLNENGEVLAAWGLAAVCLLCRPGCFARMPSGPPYSSQNRQTPIFRLALARIQAHNESLHKLVSVIPFSRKPAKSARRWCHDTSDDFYNSKSIGRARAYRATRPHALFLCLFHPLGTISLGGGWGLIEKTSA
jgi:hypothetical protein